MTIFLIVGLPGSGKTTRARELEIRESALRLTPDDWHFAVFNEDLPTAWRTPERVIQRDRIEGKLVEIGMRAARLGINVVFDFGLWSRDERSALRWIAEQMGVRAEVVYLPVTVDEQRTRITGRYGSATGHFEMDDDELQQWRQQFEPPNQDELDAVQIPAVPPGQPTWVDWALARWPSISRDGLS